MKKNQAGLVSDFAAKRILILGDVMLDRFIYGKVRRISPEAPIPVLALDTKTAMPGGAGNVARNVSSLGGHAVLVGLIGSDAEADELKALLSADPSITTALVRSSSRPTTCKTRYVAEHQQMLRLDVEDSSPAEANAAALLATVERHLPQADVVVISDYAKGVLCDGVLGAVIAAARQAGKPVVVDPKGSNYRRYDGATVMTPNRLEASVATGIAGEEDEETAAAAAALLRQVPALGAALVTRGVRGMTLAMRGEPILHIAGTPREVFDVSGAGDTAVAAIALALAAGADLPDASALANVTAGIAVTLAGTATVSAALLLNELHTSRLQSTDGKVVTAERAAAVVDGWRAKGLRVGFTNGCFDLIHPGHVSLLSQAKARCDRLVVGLNTDASIKRLKGPSRPVQNETARAIVLASLTAIDLVVPFGEDTPAALIELVRPNVLVKGADYTVETVVGAPFVRSYGGEVFLAQLVAGQSTSTLIDRMSAPDTDDKGE